MGFCRFGGSTSRVELISSDKADAEQAIASMNGEWLGSRAIRVNWANQKTQTGGPLRGGGMGTPPMGMGGGMGGMAAPLNAPAPTNSTPTYTSAPSFDAVSAQTPDFNSTVYVGNLIPYTTQADLIPLFQGYGYIVEIRMQADRGFAFVKLDAHHNAAMAITHLQNQLVHGRPIKCSWGKDKAAEGGVVAGGAAAGPPQPGAQYPMVGACSDTALMP